MKEYRRVFWDFAGRGGLKAALRMLETLDLRHAAKQRIGVPRARPEDVPEIVTWLGDKERSHGCVDLPVTDPRLGALREYLAAAGIPPVRELALRRYSSSDRATAPWLLFRWGSSIASAQESSEFDFRRACAECGAGSIAKPPLVARLGEMKGAKFATCVFDGSAITTSEVALAVERAGLTGLRFLPVRALRGRASDPRYRYVQFTYTWPRAALTSTIEVAGACQTCGRAGHFDPYKRPLDYQVVLPAREPPDFGATWELWGCEAERPHATARITCGSPRVIISQRARRVLIEAAGRAPAEPVTVIQG